ncbi:helix-turn-helix domain-containing protein [Cytobacillus praedii]|uniref:helix-turn-helix domain-containing protein n=1 Tax=Cytobacillus praedii TaxID=1742358 RepID=UPI001F60A130|nr:helix-turn-helix domain-containing protein [Cytobacillus praedii]
MEKKAETYDISFKKKAVDLYHQRKNYSAVSRELNIHRKNIQRWVNSLMKMELLVLERNAEEKVGLVKSLHLLVKILKRK